MSPDDSPSPPRPTPSLTLRQEGFGCTRAPGGRWRGVPWLSLMSHSGVSGLQKCPLDAIMLLSHYVWGGLLHSSR